MACCLRPRPAMPAWLDDLVVRFCDAWNRHSAAELALLWTDDGELNHPWGVRAVGRDAIRDLLAKELESTMSASTIRLTPSEPETHGEIATSELRGVIEGALAPNGRPYDLSHTLTAMFVRRNGEWRIHNMVAVGNPRSFS